MTARVQVNWGQIPISHHQCSLPRLGQQLVPVVRWMAFLQHLAEHPIGVVGAFISTLRVVVIHPGVHDYFAVGVIAEEQPILLEELGPSHSSSADSAASRSTSIPFASD